MEDKSNISIFQGSTVEADTVHDYLAQNSIGSLVRNHMQENLDAGWVTAAPDNAAEVWVSKDDHSRALDLLRNLYHEAPARTEGTAPVAGKPVIVQPTAANVPPTAPTVPPTASSTENKQTPPPPAAPTA